MKHPEVELRSLIDADIPRKRTVTFGDDIDSKKSKILVQVEHLLEILEHRNDLMISFTKFCSQSKKGAHLASLWQRLLEVQLRLWSDTIDKKYVQ